MYRAFVVYSGSGDNYYKHGVWASRREAEEFAALPEHAGAKIWPFTCDTKADLELQIEDDLTDAEASAYLVEQPASGHTPGPWVVKEGGLNPTSHYLVFPEGFQSATDWIFAIGTRVRNSKADASLIAAAPELLDALKEAVVDCPCSFGERNSGHKTECRAAEWLAIIAKAEGRNVA